MTTKMAKEKLIVFSAFLSLLLVGIFVAASAAILSSPSDVLQGQNTTAIVNISNDLESIASANITASTDCGAVLSYSTASVTGIAANASNLFPINISTNDADIGICTLTVNANLNNGTVYTTSFTDEFYIRYPYCGLDNNGSSPIEIYRLYDISDDTLKPLDNIDVKVKVKNTDDDDSHDVIIKAVITEDNDILEDTEVEEDVSINEDDSETVTLTLEVPADISEGKHYIYVIVYNDDNDTNCQQDEIPITIDKKTNEVILEDVTESLTAECGGTFTFSAKAANIGNSDEEEVLLEYSDDLGFSDSKLISSLDSGEQSSLAKFMFTVPQNATAGRHTIDLTVNYDYDDKDEEYDKTNEYSYYVTVSGNCINASSVADVQITSTSGTAFIGEQNDMSFIVSNSGTSAQTYTVSVQNPSWGTVSSVSPSVFTLAAGQAQVVSMEVVPNDDATAGTHSIVAVVSYSGKTSTAAISMDVQQESAGAGLLDKARFELSRNWAWYLADIVLIAGIITLAVLLANTRKSASRTAAVKEFNDFRQHYLPKNRK